MAVVRHVIDIERWRVSRIVFWQGVGGTLPPYPVAASKFPFNWTVVQTCRRRTGFLQQCCLWALNYNYINGVPTMPRRDAKRIKTPIVVPAFRTVWKNVGGHTWGWKGIKVGDSRNSDTCVIDMWTPLIRGRLIDPNARRSGPEATSPTFPSLGRSRSSSSPSSRQRQISNLSAFQCLQKSLNLSRLFKRTSENY